MIGRTSIKRSNEMKTNGRQTKDTIHRRPIQGEMNTVEPFTNKQRETESPDGKATITY